VTHKEFAYERPDPKERPNAILIAVRLPEVSLAESSASLDELERLVTTLGHRVVARVVQARGALAHGAVLGEGKLAELARLTGGTFTGDFGDLDDGTDGARESASEADLPFGPIGLIAVDHDITPSQARNLERVTGASVLDRTGVIIEIFHRHARSREARLQVEIARLKYTAPRLRESPKGKERQQGRGAGEAALELDRRRVRDRIAELTEELDAVQREQEVRRSHRRQARRVALVGYTNAGKSSLMRALTGTDVYVENKLFATLDTTVRALQPEARPRILVSDTVGFIQKLPHDLVASFKSTLDEALEASLLLHVVDAADSQWEQQRHVTLDVLREIGADAVPYRLLFNKIDRLDAESVERLQIAFPDAWFTSAKDGAKVRALRERIVGHFEASYVTREFFVPYGQERLVAEMHASGKVDREEWGETGAHVTLRTDAETMAALEARLRDTTPKA
jgi:GTP-binding protein HflX